MNLYQSVTAEQMKALRRILKNEEPEASWCWEEQRSFLEECICKRVKGSFTNLSGDEESQKEANFEGGNKRKRK